MRGCLDIRGVYNDIIGGGRERKRAKFYCRNGSTKNGVIH